MNGAAVGFARLLNPRAIAVVGASTDPQRIGGQPVGILRATGYGGAIYPVNPKYREVEGLPCHADLRSVPRPCDVAIVAVNAQAAIDAVRECGAAGIPFAIIFSAGFREAGDASAAREAELRSVARAAGVRFVGPNCLGMMNLKDRVYCGFGAGFANARLKAGPVAFVSQSGGFAFSAVGLADHEGIGFNYVVSAGNEADIGTLDLIEHFLDREDVGVVVTYLEGVADGARLRAAGERAAALGKPILVWKVGNSEAGRRAAESHTASMTAGYALYRAAFERGGYIEINDVHDLVDAVRAFAPGRLPRGRRVAVVTTSGGSGVLIADACDRHGLALPPLAPDTTRALEALAPPYASLANPVDLTAQVTADYERVNRACAHLLADPNIDQLIVRYGGVQGARGAAWANGFADVAAATDKPVLVAWSRVPDREEASLQTLERRGIPWLLTPTRAAFAAGALNRFARRRERVLARPLAAPRPLAPRPLDLPPGARTLSEHESRACLAAYGIPVTRARLLAPDALDRLLRAPLPYPLAVKADSPDIAHKTEAGAVRLGVDSLRAVKEAAREVVAAARRARPEARINGVLLAEMAEGVEAIVGAVNDRCFGPVVMFGMGGIAAELYPDVSYGFAPLDRDAAHDMIRATRMHVLLTGFRGRAPLAVDALADVLVRVSLLAADHAERIAEIDINPLFVGPAGVAAADALVVLRGGCARPD